MSDDETPEVAPGETEDAEDGRRRAPASRLTPEPEPPRTALSPRVEAWRKRSATGAILTGFAFGLKEALEPDRKDPAIVMETSGDPPRDLPVEAELEDHRPRQSVVNIRPWLLSGAEAEEAVQPDDADAVDDPEDPAAGNPADN